MILLVDGGEGRWGVVFVGLCASGRQSEGLSFGVVE